jgi:hypothetical protein
MAQHHRARAGPGASRVILRGIAHVHSRWSYDGCHDLDELAAFARERRLDFVLMSEHTRTLTTRAMAAFVEACDALTRVTGILMIPGVECEATPEHVHVLGYGVRTLVDGHDGRAIADTIRDAGGIAVLAHPAYREAWTHVDRQMLAGLDGWEVWNGKADGRWYPSGESIRRFGALRREGARLVPMAGADLHRLEADPGIVLDAACPVRDEAAVLAAVHRGAYRVRGSAWTFAASEPLREPPLSARRAAAALALTMRTRAKRAHAWLARHGLRPPSALARAARRVLQ